MKHKLSNYQLSASIAATKCTKFVFGRGSAPDPAGGAHDAPPDSPDPLVGWGGASILTPSAVVRHQRVSSRKTTARLHRVWDRLRSNERSVRQTLRTCCQPRCGYVRKLSHTVTCILISPYSYKGKVVSVHIRNKLLLFRWLVDIRYFDFFVFSQGSVAINLRWIIW